ncbi:hypothetical protein BU16DRAFT_239161 [Lophium mytilinum]|uniref:Uncharacterized protein n=1 Tax=Lophium mytilinum TaxID=390894 RepID=A0A6A6R8K4_9PEZI|nr:hypothetical protein BU16DRAFT_239161 [Lophium mytilinum]
MSSFKQCRLDCLLTKCLLSNQATPNSGVIATRSNRFQSRRDPIACDTAGTIGGQDNAESWYKSPFILRMMSQPTGSVCIDETQTSFFFLVDSLSPL